MACTNCGSDGLKWYIGKKGPPDVTDGRLRMSEIQVIAYLGCEECSETLKTVMEHEVEAMLNNEYVA